MIPVLRILTLLCALLAVGIQTVEASEYKLTAHNREELQHAVAAAKPDTTILLAPGVYPGGFDFRNIQGAPDKPIVIAAADPGNPPVIQGGGNCFHFVDPNYMELRNLILSEARANGINIDDGGSFETPAHHIVLHGLVVRDIGPDGNRDGIKLSGVDDFRVENCTVERWGNGGSGIDMVGCHRGVIEACTFRHSDEAGHNAVQTKGGSSEIIIRGCRFEHAGLRAINVGGSTGLAYFRPEPQGYEARDITVECCTFIGSGAPVAFVGVDGAVFRFNTVYRPRRWILRILQETRKPEFVPSRNGQFTDNIVAFRSDEVTDAVNIGTATAPETFSFARNFWYCLDDPSRSKPDLPVPESDGTYGINPLFRDEEKGDLRLNPESPAKNAGPQAHCDDESLE